MAWLCADRFLLLLPSGWKEPESANPGMRSRTRNLIVLLAVAIVIAAIAFVVYLRKRSAPEVVRLLPDSNAVLYAKLKTIRRLTSFGDKPVVPQEAEYADFVNQTGIQFERDLDEVAFAIHTVAKPPQRKGLPPTNETRYSEVFLGRFDFQRLSAYLRKLSKDVARYHDIEIYSIPVEDRTVRVAILGVGLIAASNVDDETVVRGIIDRWRAAAAPYQGTTLVRGFYSKIPIGSMIWALARIPPAPGDPRAARAFPMPGGIDIFVPSGSTMVASIRYLGAIHARAEFFTASEADAKHFSDQASTLLNVYRAVQEGSGQGPTDPEIKALFDSIKVESKGSSAILSASVPSDLLKKMLEEEPVGVTGAKPEQPQQQAPAPQQNPPAPKKPEPKK